MCGIIWVYKWKNSEWNLWEIALGLLKGNKNRGQDWYGLSILQSTWKIETIKFEDLYSEDVKEHVLKVSQEAIAIIWHARYPTSWWEISTNEYVQPFEIKELELWISFAFNGNIINTSELYAELKKNDETLVLKEPLLDTEVIKHMILQQVRGWEKDVRRIMEDIQNKIDGSCNIIIMTSEWSMAFSKDRLWIRPLSYETHRGNLMVSSESAAIFKMWWDHQGFLDTGDYVEVNPDTQGILEWPLKFRQGINKSRCFFETVYFADPNTKLWGTPSNLHRYRLWQWLVSQEDREQFNFQNSYVIDVPSSSTDSARGFAETVEAHHLPWVITKRPWAVRTFISEDGQRQSYIEYKYIFNLAYREILEWKKITLVDDSIVRWSTANYLTQKIKEIYNPSEIHIRIPSPAISSPCFYGINLKSLDELIIRKFFQDVDNPTDEEFQNLAEYFWVNSIKYLDIEEMIYALRVDIKDMCLACINSKYPSSWWQEKYEQQKIKFYKKIELSS